MVITSHKYVLHQQMLPAEGLPALHRAACNPVPPHLQQRGGPARIAGSSGYTSDNDGATDIIGDVQPTDLIKKASKALLGQVGPTCMPPQRRRVSSCLLAGP
jgi:hypothetical protein